MQDKANICRAPILDADEERLIECYRRCGDAGRRQLVIFAETFAARSEPLPDNVVPFPQ